MIDDSEFVLLEDPPRNFTLVGTDADGDPLTYSVAEAPAQGVLACGAGGACTYTPEANNTATQTAQLQVSDGRGGLATATLTLTVVPINDLPTVAAASVATDEDTAASTSLSATRSGRQQPRLGRNRDALHRNRHLFDDRYLHLRARSRLPRR